MRIIGSNKGTAFVLGLIVALAAVTFLAFVSTRLTERELSPTVQDVYWSVAGKRVTGANIGEEVRAHVILQAQGEYADSVAVKIRNDISFWPDSDFSTKIFTVQLNGGQTFELESAFVPERASGRSFRGYFVEVDFSVTHVKWVMEDSYPPRLKVQVSLEQVPNQSA